MPTTPAEQHSRTVGFSNGTEAPHDIRLFCLGNEADGPWQLGHMTAGEYARKAAETARALRHFDPRLGLVVCGSSSGAMPTFGEWEETVLAETYDLVDFISLHAYYEERDGDLASFLGSAADLERSIVRVASIADGVAARLGSSRKVMLAVDEWNVWYLSDVAARIEQLDWDRAPRISEEPYTAADAVVVGSLLIALLKHADRVTCACLAQLVNTIATIKAEPGGPAWREASFYPFSLTAAAARGSAIRVTLEASTIETAKFGLIPAVDAVASFDAARATAAVLVVNRDVAASANLRVTLPAWENAAVTDARLLHEDDYHAANTAAEQTRVVPRPLDCTVRDGALRLSLPPVSWAVVGLDCGD